LETVACNLCGSERYRPVYAMPDRLYFRDEFFTVVECQRCGLGFLNPRPTIAEIHKYYPPEYFRTDPSKSNERYLQRRFAREARYLATLENKVTENEAGEGSAVENGAGINKLLDVGCATGEFPRFMAERGWQVEGVEVSEVAQGIGDFPVYTQEFQDIPVNEPTYDAVTAWAVLEHVHDPMAYFCKASSVLKKNGLFVFLVPNFQSVASRNLFCEDVPRHIYFFTRAAIRQYLEKTGFQLEREDNSRSIYKLAPYNWLGYTLRSRVLGRGYSYEDVPLTSKEFRRIHKLPRRLLASLKYAAYSPLSVVDRMLWPVIETAQMWIKRYGVSTYVARKI
jgi:SAM-dependent methyltransferase